MSEVITEREIKVLEFNQIQNKLSGMTVSPMGREIASQILPSVDPELISHRLKETSEARLLCSKNAFNPPAVEDIKPYLVRAEKGAMLSSPELAGIMIFIKSVQRWPNFFSNRDNRELYPILTDLSRQINMCEELYATLRRALDEDGNILDGASSELSSLRRKKHSLQNKIREKLDQYVRSANYQRYLQDALVTIRGGRYVLPVKQEYRHYLEGVVHDQSASGATFFIEPLPVVEMQNSLTSLQKQEEEEIERILFQLSSQVASADKQLANNRDLYGKLDFIVACGRLSLEMGGIEPVLYKDEKERAIFDQAIHPLLSGEKVPLSVELGDNAQTLVVTGPNTGGKTVALKTIGLLTIMAQCGLHVPAKKDTKLTVFEKIRADIGDEQSIVQSLSTFSGHMKNIISIVEKAGSGSLVLFDELGAGTDPTEGAALAMAILEELTTNGALTVATTHINELKLFAQRQEKMQNAAMEFDLDTLAPTYRLLQGIPGQSNAFYIAGQLGLPENVLQRAKSFMHRSHEQVESIIASLVEDQQRYSKDSRQAELERNRAEMMMAELEKERNLLRARREDIIKEAREEARQLVRRVKKNADELIKELRTIKSEGGEQSLAQAEQVRNRLNELRREVEAEREDEEDFQPQPLNKDDLYVGREVYINSLKQSGEIISISGSEAMVQVGAIKVNLPVKELMEIQKGGQSVPEKRSKAGTGFLQSHGYSVRKDASVKSSLDLRGLTLEEATPMVDKFLDNALWAGLNQVDLIHGKGTGKLKQGLWSYLKDHRLVRKYRVGETGEGGEGVTVVEIRA
ncbi:MAG: endonuclease MutS2 [Bacillota bacterium]